MDTETLVSNGFRELQEEAINEAYRKNTLTEKLTTVKNNVCENNFHLLHSRLQRQKMSRLKQLLDHSNKLRQEVKLLALDKQRHSVEVRKRMAPDKDYSYDDTQLVSMERRLGVHMASYLDKKLQYPTRLKPGSDISVTPVVRKARASLRLHDLHRSLAASTVVKSASALKSLSSSYTVPSSSSSTITSRWMGSKSASIYTRSTPQIVRETLESHISPAISRSQSKTAHRSTPSIIKSGSFHRHSSQVKFTVQSPPVSREASLKLSSKSHTYCPAASASVSEYSDDEDDNTSLPNYIDLKSLFFGKNSEDSSKGAQSRHSARRLPRVDLRKVPGQLPKMTTEMKEEEADYIHLKIQKFLRNLVVPRRPPKHDTDNLLDELQTVEAQAIPFHPKGTYVEGNSVEESDPPAPITQSPPTTQPFSHENEEAAHENSQVPAALNEDNRETKEARKPKYNWRYIRGHPADGQLHGTYTPEDLVLQSLTGVPLSNVLNTRVPMHCASRATRYTATYKMHKIVERLIQERTKYQRHQVEELKRQMTQGADDTTNDSAGSDQAVAILSSRNENSQQLNQDCTALSP